MLFDGLSLLVCLLLIDLWNVASILGYEHPAKLVLILWLDIGKPNLVLIFICIDFFETFASVSTCHLSRFALLDFNSLLASEEKFSVILLVVYLFADS